MHMYFDRAAYIQYVLTPKMSFTMHSLLVLIDVISHVFSATTQYARNTSRLSRY